MEIFEPIHPDKPVLGGHSSERRGIFGLAFRVPDLDAAIPQAEELAQDFAPEDVAACALYLASPAASYVTGQICCVHGGITTTQVEMPRAAI